jgi:hypothetical protein
MPHWITMVCSGDDCVDLIFSSGNGVCTVDDDWFRPAVGGEFLGVPVEFCPPEETIWSKACAVRGGRARLGIRRRATRTAGAMTAEDIAHATATVSQQDAEVQVSEPTADDRSG